MAFAQVIPLKTIAAEDDRTLSQSNFPLVAHSFNEIELSCLSK